MQIREKHTRPARTLAFLVLACLFLLPLAHAAQPAYPLLSNEVHSTTPGPHSSLDIQLTPVCENEDHIEVQVLWNGKPVSDAVVKLYRYDRGRAFDSQVTTSPGGWAFFHIRPAGSYDMTALMEGNGSSNTPNDLFGQIFFKMPPCLSPPSGVGLVPERPSFASVAAAPSVTQTYPGGATRVFEAIRLADGTQATRVRISLPVPSGTDKGMLVEDIPAEVAATERALGFENNYPLNIRSGSMLELIWGAETGGSLMERTYVILRPYSPELTMRWGAPRLEAPAPALLNTTSAVNGTASAGKSGGTGQNASATPANSQTGAPFDFGTLLLALLSVLVLGAGGWMLLSRRKKTDGEKAEQK